MPKKQYIPTYGQIRTPKELGIVLRAFRKQHKYTLTKVSALTTLSIRFISEVERGKETTELGKVLTLIQMLGLNLFIYPRTNNTYPSFSEIRSIE